MVAKIATGELEEEFEGEPPTKDAIAPLRVICSDEKSAN